MDTYAILVRACVAGGLMIGGTTWAQEQVEPAAGGAADTERTTQMEQTGRDMAAGAPQPRLPDGFRASTDADDERDDLRELLASAVEAAFTEDGFDDLVERFVDQDRNRIGDLRDAEEEALDGVVEIFQQNWEEKYGNDFDIDDDRFLPNLAVVTGEVENSERAMAMWPVSVDGSEQTARTAGAADGEDEIEAANLEEGRAVAVAVVTHQEMPALHLSLLDELGGWKIDLPDEVTRQTLHNRVSSLIRTLNVQTDQWPDTEAEAYEKVGHMALMAFHGLDPTAARETDRATPAGETQDGELRINTEDTR